MPDFFHNTIQPQNRATKMRHNIITDDLKEIISDPLPFDKFSGKTVLVTGANGFLPAYLIESLLFLNEINPRFDVHIIALARNSESATNRFRAYLNRKDLSFLIQDVTEPIVISNPIDYIIHAASQASPKYYGIDPVGTLGPNVFGTGNLLKLAAAKNVSGFLFFSSGDVYGGVNSNQIPIKEISYGYLDCAKINSCYAESKRMGENLCVSWRHQYGVPAIIVRPFHTYGPGLRLDDGRVFADFVANIVRNENIVMKSDGSAKRAFCYLADATRGFFTALLKGKPGETYNVGFDKAECSIKDLAELLVNLYPEKQLCVIEAANAHNNNYLKSIVTRSCPDISKLNNLGWCPRYSLQEGFRRTIDSFT